MKYNTLMKHHKWEVWRKSVFHDIAEILLKVTLRHQKINQSLPRCYLLQLNIYSVFHLKRLYRINYWIPSLNDQGCCFWDRMVVGYTSAFAVIANHHWRLSILIPACQKMYIIPYNIMRYRIGYNSKGRCVSNYHTISETTALVV
jgi:hypothetical protein